MTIDAAQIELLKALGSGTAGQGLPSLLQDLGSSSGAGLLSQVLAGNNGVTAGGTSLLSELGGALSGSGAGGTGSGGLLELSPILAGLKALFGGGAAEPLPTLTKYAAPDSLNLSLGVGDGGQSLGPASYGQNGAPRLAPAITVNVNAIDSKSFSDHSEAIAQVVREAMLNSGALTDVVSEI